MTTRAGVRRGAHAARGGRRIVAPAGPEASRVLMTADAIGGVWTHALELCRALAGSNVRTTLAVLGEPPSEQQRRRATSVPGLDLFEFPCRLEWMEDPWEDVERSSAWLLDLERRVQPDVIHLNGYAHAALPWRAPRLVVGHSCVLSWWRAVHGRAAPRRYRTYRAAVRRGIRAAEAVVTPTAAFGRALVRHYGTPPNLRTIPNGRRAADFPCGRKDELVLVAGRLWDDAKNVELVRRVAPRLPVPVFAAGDCRADERSSITCLGRLADEELAGWYRRAAVLVHPARYEPFGLGPLEAALAGCALVLGDIASLREVWGGAATYVAPDDAAGLQDAVETLVRHPERRRRLAARARRRALQYSPERMARSYHAVYRELVSRRTSAARAGTSEPAALGGSGAAGRPASGAPEEAAP